MAADMAVQQKADELVKRIKNKGKLPLITACSQGWDDFAKENYPELLENHGNCENLVQIFGKVMKNNEGGNQEKTIPVSISPCMAKKYNIKYSLVPAELMRMLFMKGIDLGSQIETPFDIPDIKPSAANAAGANEADTASLKAALAGDNSDGIREVPLKIAGTEVKIILVNGIAKARKVLDSVREGKCGAALIDIRFCTVCKATKT